MPLTAPRRAAAIARKTCAFVCPIPTSNGILDNIGRALREEIALDGNGLTALLLPRFPARKDMMQEGRKDSVIAARALVSIVDDDESVRESLPDLVRQFGFTAQAFSSAEAFLQSNLIDDTRCLILDIAMPGMSGPDLQRELTRRRHAIPTIFITANEDKSLRPRLLAEGAVDCLFKPFSDAALLEALNIAFRKDGTDSALKETGQV